jgi:N4-gp56 family major capsid protein
MATSTTTTNAANLHLYYERKLLSTLEPRLVLQPLGKSQRLPKGLGTQVKWLRYSTIADSTTPLTEGTPPSEIAFTTANVTASIAQYGQFSKVSDLLSDVAIDPVLRNLSERFGFAAAKTIEQLIVNELDAEAAVQYVNDVGADGSVTASDVLNHKELIEAQIQQKKAFIGPHESGDYVAVIHPCNEFDLKSDSQAGAWLDINKRTNPAQEKMMNGQFGKMYGMRLLVSDKMTLQEDAGAATVDVVSNYVIGEEAFGVVKLDGRAVRMIIKRHGSAGANDPLDQFATVGYKIHGYATKYLDSGTKRVIRIKGASAIAD